MNVFIAVVLSAVTAILPLVQPPLTVASAVCVVSPDGRAPSTCSPGSLNPNVVEGNIRTTICVPRWTDSVRPPTSYTNAVKKRQMIEYGLTARGVSPSGVEEDHVVPLSLGGSPRDPRNLFPELWEGPRGAHRKDVEERALHSLVCKGKITLGEARKRIVDSWTYRPAVG